MKNSFRIFLIILSIVTTFFVFGFTNNQVVYAAQNEPTGLLTSNSNSMEESSAIGIIPKADKYVPGNHFEENKQERDQARTIVIVILSIYFTEAIVLIIIKLSKRRKPKK